MAEPINDFYDERDDLVGGTDTIWTPDWTGRDWAPVVDQRADDDNRFSGVLSQSELA
jgi:hypothetical protein